MQIYLNGDPVTLDKRMVLGSGGEGTVYKVTVNGKKVALKVYETPTRERSLKLLAFDKLSPKFPDQVIAPQILALNGRDMAIGFTMPLLLGKFEEIASLSNKKYRTSFGTTTKDVSELFLDGISTLESVHKQGFVVGDLNDRNELFQGSSMLWIDVDSYQFGTFPCPVATETFIDPGLYGIDLSLKPVFSAGNDWYSYAVMLFKSLLLVHPYGGTHKTVDGLMKRATKKISVFDSGVTYPIIGISPDILTDDLHSVFDGYFQKGQRNPFPESILRDYLDSLRECTSCGTYFPSTRGNCPVCSAKVLIVIQRPKVSAKGIEVIEILRVNGQILLTRVVGDEVRVLANENGKLVFYSKRPNLTASTRVIMENIPGAKFEMNSEQLFVNLPSTTEILVYNLSDGRLVGKITTAEFVPNRKAVFRASDEYIFRIDKGKLTYGRIVLGRLEENVLRQVMEDQTWFWVDTVSTEPSVFGLFQVLRQQMFWMIKDGNFFDVDIPQLDKTENVIDISVKFSSQGVYLLRKTQHHGKDYLRQDLVDASGKVIFTNRVEESTHPNPEVHGQAYGTGMVLHPTDEGIMQEEVKSGKTKIFDGTKGFVDGTDTLIRYGSSILAVKSDSIIQISVK